MLMISALDFSLSLAIAALRFQHNLITGHRLTGLGWTPVRREPEPLRQKQLPVDESR
jgi:hypothetical protein